MRDGSDWHPRLTSAVAEIAGQQDLNTVVRSRIYSTSASTMHSLCAEHGQRCGSDHCSRVRGAQDTPLTL